MPENGEVVRRTLAEGPRAVTRRGEEEEVVVAVPAEEYRGPTGDRPDFKEFLMNGPDLGLLDLERPANDLARGPDLPDGVSSS